MARAPTRLIVGSIEDSQSDLKARGLIFAIDDVTLLWVHVLPLFLGARR